MIFMSCNETKVNFPLSNKDHETFDTIMGIIPIDMLHKIGINSSRTYYKYCKLSPNTIFYNNKS